MKTFHITRPDESIRPALIDKINNLTKPKGSLGILEELALQIGLIQQTLSPTLKHPQNIIFAADHGIVEEGVSLSPKEITWQQISNFLHGGAGVNFLCRQHGFTLKIVDAGVDYDLPYEKGIINMKVRKSTRSYLHEAAMTEEEMEMCLERGAEVVRQCHEEGSNVLSFGEMGIGNTSSSSLWMTCFTGIPLEQCVGAGSGLDSAGIRHKYEVLKQSMENYKVDGSPRDIIRYFGGLEMVMAIGAMLQAAELRMIILVDGFIMTNCLLAAARLYPEVTDYAIFGHCGRRVRYPTTGTRRPACPSVAESGAAFGRRNKYLCISPLSTRPCGCSMKWITLHMPPSPNTFNMNNVLAAFIMLTRLPFWKIKEVPAECFKHVVPYWPLVGWLTGGVMAAVLWLAGQIMPVSLAWILALIARLLVTGCLHEDGLADFFDGFGGGTTRERTLAIMKDSHIGSYGVIGLICYFLLLFQLHHLPLGLLCILVLSGDCWSEFCASQIVNYLPYARKEEDSKSKTVLQLWAGAGNEHVMDFSRICFLSYCCDAS